MTPLEALHDLQQRALVTIEDGDPCEAVLLPPLSADQVAALERSLGCPIPAEVRELLAVTAGVTVDDMDLAWAGGLGGQDVPGVLPTCLPVLLDGCGNSWNVDIDPDTGAWGAVYFECHDAPVVVYQAPSLAAFITQFADECARADREGELNVVIERAVDDIWSTGGNLQEVGPLRQSADPVLRAAADDADGALVCDLRGAKVGDGFAWAWFGARTEIVRPTREPVWVLRRPARVKRWWKLWA